MREVIEDDFRFYGKSSPAATASVVDGPWAKTDTSAAGSPTLTTAAGFLELALDSQNEVQNLCLSFGDILTYDIDDLLQIDIWAKLTASLPAAVSVALGLASARNDAIDSIANAALFRCIGDNNVVVESDDGATDKDDIATGMTLSTTVRRHTISFAEGIRTNAGALSTGGKSNVIFSMENSQGLLRRVAPGTIFDMSNYSGGLQPYFQVQKTAAASVATLSLQRIRVRYRPR